MDERDSQLALRSKLRHCSALAAAMLLAMASAACDADKQAVPDPNKPPLPKTAQHQ